MQILIFINFLSTLLLLLTATRSAKGQKTLLSSLSIRSTRQEGQHTWHLTAFTLAVLRLGLAAGISRLPQHSRLPLGRGYAPDAIQKGIWEAAMDEWHCLGGVQVPHWEESLSGQFCSPTHSLNALCCLGPRPSTGTNHHRARPTTVSGSLVLPKSEHRCSL